MEERDFEKDVEFLLKADLKSFMDRLSEISDYSHGSGNMDYIVKIHGNKEIRTIINRYIEDINRFGL